MTRSVPHIQIIVGSVRDGRASKPVALWLADEISLLLQRPVEILDLRDWALPDFNIAQPPAMGTYPDRRQQMFASTIARADAFVIVAPEYNHGYTAALKNAFDWIYAEWAGKPVLFVSFGNAGGTRAVQQLKQVLGELRLVPVEPVLSLKPHGRISHGKFQGAEEDRRRLGRGLDELLRWEEALRPVRSRQVEASRAEKRVLVVGLDPETNRNVVAPLVAAGVAAEGLVLTEGSALPEFRDYDLVAIGRGAAGAKAEEVRRAVAASNPGLPIIDVVGPFAVRQIEAALDPDRPQFSVSELSLDDNRLRLRVSGEPGRLGVTALEREEAGLLVNRLAEISLLGEIALTLDIATRPYSIMVDLDGAAFFHFAVV